MDSEKVVLDRDDIRRTLVRIAHEIVEKNAEPDRLAIVGIHRRGAVLAAARPPASSRTCSTRELPLGDLDISFYRDDVTHARTTSRSSTPATSTSRSTGMTVVIVDDVLYTGRTVRAAIEALFDYGRPARIQLAVLADRGHRELPFRPDYVGKNLPTAALRARQRPRRRARRRRRGRHRRQAGGPRVRHLISVEHDLDRARIERIVDARRLVRGGRAPADQEGPGAARAHRPEPLLRGLDAHALARSSSRPSA